MTLILCMLEQYYLIDQKQENCGAVILRKNMFNH